MTPFDGDGDGGGGDGVGDDGDGDCDDGDGRCGIKLKTKNPLRGSVLQGSPAELGGLLCCRPKLRSPPSNTAAGPSRGRVHGLGAHRAGPRAHQLARGPWAGAASTFGRPRRARLRPGPGAHQIWLAVDGLGRGPRLAGRGPRARRRLGAARRSRTMGPRTQAAGTAALRVLSTGVFLPFSAAAPACRMPG